MAPSDSISFSGLLMSIQPRIRLTRSFDQRSHTYLGYLLRVRESVGTDERDVLVAIGVTTQAEHRLRSGDRVSGQGHPVPEPKDEIAELYKVSKLEVLERGDTPAASGPPWQDVAPAIIDLSRARAPQARRKNIREHVRRVHLGCRMPVEMIIDQWKPDIRRYRHETFCYGPLSCRLYRAGPWRRVPGRRGMTWVEDDWVDDEEVRHRAPDD
jgi:hypothetical protein